MGKQPNAPNPDTTFSLHGSSFLGLPFRILNIELVKPKKGTTIWNSQALQTRVEALDLECAEKQATDGVLMSCRGNSIYTVMLRVSLLRRCCRV